ncbi:MAG: DegT/DnrJ/EryC1/StrS aminotransferase family protein [bacterium]|nr:DegT/DnrJ/EryC1/StrS aminotransferase family protein [bacterium]
MKDDIPHSRPTLDEADAQAAAEAVRSGQIAEGPRVAEFERQMAAYLKRSDAVAVSSGLAALHLALHAMGVGPGCDVVIPSYNCAALLQAVRHTGARARLCDVDPETGNPTPETVGAAAEGARAVIVTHLFGAAAETDDIAALGVPVIEDIAQGLGASRMGSSAGAAGRLAICSFYATKLLTTGEGGMIAGDDAALLAAARDARSYDERENTLPRWNYKLTDLQAALGLSQLARYERFIEARRKIAACYREGLAESGLGLPGDPPAGRHVYHRYVVRLPEVWGEKQGPGAADAACRAFAAEGIGVRRPIHAPLHRLLGESGFPGTEAAWARHISLPIYPSLTADEADRIMDAARRIFQK